MSQFNDSEDPQRRKLIQRLGLGAFSLAVPYSTASAFNLFGDKPEKLTDGQSIYRLTGSASVNDIAVTKNTLIRPGDRVKTGKDSELVFAVGTQAMILRDEAELVIDALADDLKSMIIGGLYLITGKLLSVSRDTPMEVRTVTGTIGIRGTGWYIEADPEQTYFCTCYGTTDIVANKDGAQLTVAATHHDQPVYILGDNASGKSIRKAPFINHTDQELMLIETLVGRTPPFVFPKDDYNAPRLDY
ncbi:MAG: hypothetical protein ACI9YO_003068 [Gammaproteobacteria bacterium]|jgi:hypothetical protein